MFLALEGNTYMLKKMTMIGLAVFILIGLIGCEDTRLNIDVLEITSPTNATDIHIENGYTQEYQDDHNVFVTTIRIHDDMPEFTFYHIIGELEPEPWYGPFPYPRNVTIVIKNDIGNIIQKISDLTQSSRHAIDGRLLVDGIIFEDYNFNGYLDMRLKRWQERASINYFWSWNKESSQFVLNEQLAEIAHEASEISLNQKTQQLGAFFRTGGSGGNLYVYEYHNDEFVLVDFEEIIWGEPSRFWGN